MKAKKLAALLITCAIAATATSLMVACNKDDDDDKTAFVEDTRIWYAVGNSDKKGDLKENNWTPATICDNLKFTRQASETENVFVAEFNIYAGDGFKFVYKTSATEEWTDALWPRQIGIHHFEGVSGEGENAVLKSGEETVFTTRGGMDANNLYLAKGHDGRYKFTLKTFPEDTSKEPELKFELVSKIEITHDMYLYGDINDYGFGGKIDAYPMIDKADGEDNVKWVKELVIKQEDLVRDENGNLLETDKNGNIVDGVGKYVAVQVYNKVLKDSKHATYVDSSLQTIEYADAYAGTYPAGTAKTFNLLEEGKYVITYDQKTDAVTIVKSAYDLYLIGGFNEWAEADEDYKMTEGGDGAYWYGTIDVPAAGYELKVFNKLGATDKYFPAGGNISLTEGKWAIKYNTEDNSVQYEKFDYFVVGTFVDGSGNKCNFANGMKAEVNPVLTVTSDPNVYTAEITVTDVSGVDGYGWVAPDIFACKVLYGTCLLGDVGGTWYNPVASQNKGDNLKFSEAGTYVITLTLTDDGEGNVTGECSYTKKN